MAAFKKGLMKYVWRLQQVAAVSGIFFWSLTLTLLLDPYSKPIIINLFNLDNSQVFIRLLLTFLIVFGGLVAFGVAYDRLLQLWKEQQIVAQERNPFAKNAMYPKEILHWQFFNIPLLRHFGMEKEAIFYEKWNERLVKEDLILKEEVFRIAQWIDEYDLPPPEKRILGDLNQYKHKVKTTKRDKKVAKEFGTL